MTPKKPLEFSEVIQIADSIGSGNVPLESKEHIKEFFDTTNVKHKTRLKAKDVQCLTILETRWAYYKKRYGLDIEILKILCNNFRDNRISEGGKSREEFVDSIKSRMEYPLIAENLKPAVQPSGLSGMARRALER